MTPGALLIDTQSTPRFARIAPETLATIFFALCCMAYLASIYTFGRTPAPDEVFFKAAGVHWVNGDGFRAPEEENYAHWQPPLHEVFASYPPLYPALFGIAKLAFGFHWRTIALFDAVIHVGLLIVLSAYFRRSLPPDWAVAVWLFLPVLLFVGTSGRPDELAMLFGYAAITTLIRPLVAARSIPAKRAIGGGILLGACGAASVPCAIVLSFTLAGAVLQNGRYGKPVWQQCAVTLSIAVALAIGSLLLIEYHHPGALAQNLYASRMTAQSSFLDGVDHALRYHRPPSSVFPSCC